MIDKEALGLAREIAKEEGISLKEAVEILKDLTIGGDEDGKRIICKDGHENIHDVRDIREDNGKVVEGEGCISGGIEGDVGRDVQGEGNPRVRAEHISEVVASYINKPSYNPPKKPLYDATEARRNTTGEVIYDSNGNAHKMELPFAINKLPERVEGVATDRLHNEGTVFSCQQCRNPVYVASGHVFDPLSFDQLAEVMTPVADAIPPFTEEEVGKIEVIIGVGAYISCPVCGGKSTICIAGRASKTDDGGGDKYKEGVGSL